LSAGRRDDCCLLSFLSSFRTRLLYIIPDHSSCHGMSYWLRDLLAIKLP